MFNTLKVRVLNTYAYFTFTYTWLYYVTNGNLIYQFVIIYSQVEYLATENVGLTSES